MEVFTLTAKDRVWAAKLVKIYEAMGFKKESAALDELGRVRVTFSGEWRASAKRNEKE